MHDQNDVFHQWESLGEILRVIHYITEQTVLE